jgi:hypothetical protein
MRRRTKRKIIKVTIITLAVTALLMWDIGAAWAELK